MNTANEKIDLSLFPSIADSYECVTEDARMSDIELARTKAAVDAFARTVMAEIQTIVAKRSALAA